VNLPIDPSPLIISLATTCTATVATFFLGLLAARAMYGLQGSLRAWIDGILTLPLVLPPTVIGFFLLLLFGRRSPVGHLLEQIGATVVFSWPATVIAATVVAFPLMYRTSLGALEQVNPTLLQAARTLGASEWRVFRRVLLPLAAPGVLAGTVLAFARALGEFGATLMLAGNIPGRTQTMPIAVFSAAEGGDMRAAFVWVAIIVGLSLAIIRLLNYQGSERKARVATGFEPLQTSMAFEADERSRATEVSEPTVALAVDVERALDSFRLQVRFETGRGAVGLLGASGAGKSVTLRLIAGVAVPDKGRIVLNGRVLFDSATGEQVPAAQRRIGVVFQDYALFPHMTVAENIAFGLHGLPAAVRDARVREQLKRMRICELAGRYPRQISGGQRQRTAIARAMAIEPDALLLDEPFAALDPHLRRQTEEQLREILRSYNGVVVFVTHDMEEAFRFCQNLLVLDRGRVIASGPKHELFEQPRSVVTARLTGCKNIAPARQMGAARIAVEAWDCELALAAPHPGLIRHVGYRSHHFRFLQSASGDNVFPCWLVETSEAPHEMTLYLRLHRPPAPGDAPHLQADIPKEQWRALRSQPQPWQIQIDPGRLLLLEDG
jgi:molybdate transport system permease protein